MKTRDNIYAATYVEQENSLLIQEWKSATEKMKNSEYKAELVFYKDTILSQLLEKVLIDTKKFRFIISPDLQKWVDTQIAFFTNKIVKKIAFVMPEEIFAEVSIQQTMEEEEATKYGTSLYFENRDLALEWLLK